MDSISRFPVLLPIFAGGRRRRRAEDDLFGTYVVEVYLDRVEIHAATERREIARALELLSRVIARSGRQREPEPRLVDWNCVEQRASRLAEVEVALLDALCDEPTP